MHIILLIPQLGFQLPPMPPKLHVPYPALHHQHHQLLYPTIYIITTTDLPLLIIMNSVTSLGPASIIITTT